LFKNISSGGILSARIDPVKGVQWNWLTFLWENMARIRKEQRTGNSVTALEQLCSLVWFSSRALKRDFLERAEKIQKEMVSLRTGINGTSLLSSHMNQNRAVEAFAKTVFPQFIKEFTTALDEAGYMERRGSIPTGLSHTLRKMAKKKP